MIDGRLTNDVLIQSIEYSTVSHSIARVDGDQELVYVNRAFLEATGYDREDVIGRNCRFLQGPGTDPAAVQAISRSLSAFEPIEMQILNYRKDGSPFLNHLRLTPVFDANRKPIAFVGVQSDVTRLHEDHRMEQERRHMEALGRMAGNVSHEIKNALQPIRIMTDVLKDWPTLTELQRVRSVEILDENVTLADGIVKNVLGYARKRGVDVEDLALADLKRDLVSFVRHQLTERVRFVLDDASPSEGFWFARARRNHILQVMTNLVSNAVHAMDGVGELALLWRHETVDATKARKLGLKAGPHLVIGVRDTGCGIDAKYAGEVFGPFFSTKPPGQGTGLGLSVCAQIVKTWHGALDFVSTPGAGTTFFVHLPITARPTGESGSAGEPSARPRSNDNE